MNIYDCLRLPLGDVPAECIERFDCGREDINNFFHHDVERNQRQMFGKTYFGTKSVCKTKFDEYFCIRRFFCLPLQRNKD